MPPRLSDPQRRLQLAGSGHYKPGRIMGIYSDHRNPHMRRAPAARITAAQDSFLGQRAQQLANGDARRWSDDAA